MSESNPIRVYVAHNFNESDDYLRVFEFLESIERFFYVNVSKPENVPASGGMDAIKEELISQIKECEAMIMPATLYIDQNDTARFQLDVAKANQKPVITIRPFGGIVDTPQPLVDQASEHIEWNEREIVDALKRQARREDTSRWETIEFTLD